MNKRNLDKLEREVRLTLEKREKRKRRRMKVSGGSVKKLRKIIIVK